MPRAPDTHLHPKASRVQQALDQLGSRARVVQLSESARTAAEAADALGTTVAQIVKSLVFLAGGNAVLVLASGPDRVSMEKLSALLAMRVTKPAGDVVKEVTGYAIGGIPPVAHATGMRVLMDRKLLEHQVVWAAAGTPHAVFSITPAELQRVAQAEVVDVCE